MYIMHIYIYIYIYIYINGPCGEICSLNQFFRGHFAYGDKNMSPKSLFLNFTSYVDNSLAVIVYSVWTVELFHQSFLNTPSYVFIGLQNNMIYICENVNRDIQFFSFSEKFVSISKVFFLFSSTCFIPLLYRHS